MSDPYRTPGEIDKIFAGKPRRDWGKTMKELFLGTLVIASALFIVSLVAYPISRWVLANGEADYCFVWVYTGTERKGDKDEQVILYSLQQHVPWGSNRVLESGIKTSEEVRKEAEAFKCPLR